MKTRFVFSLLFLSFLTFNGFGQYKGFELRINPSASYKLNLPVEILSDRDDVTFKASLFSMDAIGYFAFNERVSGRVRLGYRGLTLKGDVETYDVNDYSYKLNGKLYNRTVTIAPGITRNFTFDKLTFLTTAELPVVLVGGLKGELEVNEEDNSGMIVDQKNTVHVDGGVAFGLNGAAGFRYNLYKGLSVGMDLNMGVNYFKVKGKGELETFDSGASTSYFDQDFKSRLLSVTPLSGSLVVGMKF